MTDFGPNGTPPFAIGHLDPNAAGTVDWMAMSPAARATAAQLMIDHQYPLDTAGVRWNRRAQIVFVVRTDEDKVTGVKSQRVLTAPEMPSTIAVAARIAARHGLAVAGQVDQFVNGRKKRRK